MLKVVKLSIKFLFEFNFPKICTFLCFRSSKHLSPFDSSLIEKNWKPHKLLTLVDNTEMYLKKKRLSVNIIMIFVIFFKDLFLPQGYRFPSLPWVFYFIAQWSCSASGSLWEMPDSNPGPLISTSLKRARLMVLNTSISVKGTVKPKQENIGVRE